VRIRSVAAFAIGGAVLGAGVGFVVTYTDTSNPLWTPVLGLSVGFSVSLWIGLFEEFAVHRLARRMSHWRLNVVRFFAYLATCVASLILGAGIYFSRLICCNVWTGMIRYVTEESFWPRDLIIVAAGTPLLLVAMLVRRLHDRTEMLALLSGRYHYPREETRTVLFADLSGSTSIAERLGPLDYSAFLRDFFTDLSESMLGRRGRLYQHLGDGAIITWPFRNGGQDARAVQCLFDMGDILEKHRAYYEERYGIVPAARGGIHVGPVIATWVGVARFKLALHGDVLNTAARIQSQCRELGVTCLVSEDYASSCILPEDFRTVDLGMCELRGKSHPMRLLSVERALIGE